MLDIEKLEALFEAAKGDWMKANEARVEALNALPQLLAIAKAAREVVKAGRETFSNGKFRFEIKIEAADALADALEGTK